MALTEKNKGELLTGLATIVLILGLAFLGFALGYEWPRHNALRAEGKVTEAYVSDLHELTSGSRRSRSTNYVITVKFSSKAGVPFKDAAVPAKPGKVTSSNPISHLDLPFLQKTGARKIPVATDTTAQLNKVSYALYSKLGLGSSLDVVYLPSDPSFVLHVDTLRTYSSLPMAISGLLISLLGSGMLAFGLKKMKQ